MKNSAKSFRSRLLMVFTVSVTLILLTCVIYQALNYRLLGAMDQAVDLVQTLNRLEQLKENASMINSQIGQLPQSMDVAQNQKLLNLYLERGKNLVLQINSPTLIHMESEIANEINKNFAQISPPAIQQLTSELDEEINRTSITLRDRLDKTYNEIQKQKHKPLLTGLSAAFTFAAILTILFFSVYGRFKNFINNMNRVTDRAAGGDLSVRGEQTGDDELSSVESRFNDMLAEIETLHRDLARSNRDLEDFAHMASHDLQAPLRYISAYSDMITDKKQNFSDEERQQFAKNIQVSTLRLSLLISDLLKYSKVRVEGLEREVCDVNELCAPLAEEAKVRFPELSLAVMGDGRVPGYRRLLQAVFQNLLENTLKYSRRSDVKVSIETMTSTDGYRIVYQDNGPGIPLADRDRVFDLFHRRDVDKDLPGSGVGLAICKKIISLHQGEITLLPSEQGARFQIEMPL